MKGVRGAAVASKTRPGTSSLSAIAFIIAVPVLIFAYLLFQPSTETGPQRVFTVFRYDDSRNVSCANPININQLVTKIRDAFKDPNIARLFSFTGRHLRKSSALSDRIIALDATEHFYWPFVEEGYVHDLSKLHLDRNVRLISRSDKPHVFEIENFLSPEECDEIIRIGMKKGLEASPLILAEYEKGYDWSQARTSQGVFVDHWVKPMLQRISVRAANLTRIPSHYSEHLQIIHYNSKQHYWAHYDWIDPSVEVASWPVRMAGGVDNRYLTILFYLNDVPKGGYTTFPRSSPLWTESIGFNAAICEEEFKALRVYPHKGNAVMFYNVLPNGQKDQQKDPMSLHAGCDPIDSEKWAANFWIHLAPMRDPGTEQSYCVGDDCHPH